MELNTKFSVLTRLKAIMHSDSCSERHKGAETHAAEAPRTLKLLLMKHGVNHWSLLVTRENREPRKPLRTVL